MPPILPSTALTAGQLLIRLAESFDDLVWTGTSTGGSSTTTVIDTSIPSITDGDSTFQGVWFYGISGLSVAEERIIDVFSGTSSRLTTLTPITNPDSGGNHTTYFLTRKYKPSMLLRAIQAAQRDETEAGTQLLPVVGREGIVGNLVANGAMDLYTTANVPDSLTLDTHTAFTMETVVTAGPRRALKGITDGSNAGFVRYAVPQWGRFAGRTAYCYAKVRASIASRVSLQFDDGVAVSNMSPGVSNAWTLLNLTPTLSAAAAKAQISIEVSAGSAVTFYVQFLYLPDPQPLFEQAPIDADRNLIWIGNLKVSDYILTQPGAGYEFGLDLQRQNFAVVEDTEDLPRYLRLDAAGNYRGRVLEYTGYKYHAELTGPTISYTGKAEVLLARARYYVLLWDPDSTQAQVQQALAEAERLEQKSRIRIPSGRFRKVQA